MKRSLLIILSVIGITALVFSQEKVSYIEVVKVDSASKSQLFSNARSWLNESFRDSKSVIQIADKETGELEGKGAFPFYSQFWSGSSATKGFIYFLIKITVKDNRYRYEFTNFTHEGSSGSNGSYSYPAISFGLITTADNCPNEFIHQGEKWEKKLWDEIKEDIFKHSYPMIQSLKQRMAQKESDNSW